MLLSLALATLVTAAPPRNVYVGAYLTDVSDFDLKAGRFKADMRVWVKWLGDANDVPEITFENGEIDSKEDLGRENDAAWHSVKWRVQGTFRGDFPLHAFPFDRQTLPVVFGLQESEGVLVPDLGASGMSSAFSITGWSYEPYFQARTETRLYRSDLGSVATEGQNAKERLTLFSLELRRPFGPYLLKFALPLTLILIVALLALLLPADRLDVRSAMGVTALLACFAFHYTQGDTLPNVTYVVAADKLFLGAYLFVAGTLLLSIGSYRIHEKAPLRARNADRLGLWLLPLFTVIAVFSLVSTSLATHVKEPSVDVAPTAERVSQPLLRIAVPTLDNPTSGGQFPSTRAALVVRGADGQFVPVLAERAPSMINELVRLLPNGGMRVRWQLREHAKWSDGSPMTSADLEFSAALVNEPLREHLERVDGRTLDITYTKRRSDWLSGFTVFPATRSKALPDAGRDVLNRAVAEGTLPSGGPWLVEKFEAKKSLVLARNPHFTGLKPTFERVEVQRADPDDATKLLLSGAVDIIPSLTADAYEALRADERVRVLEQPGELAWMLVPKLGGAPWDSLEHRRALLAAIDRTAMVHALAPAPTRAASGWRALPDLAPAASSVKLEPMTLTLNVAPIRSDDATHAILARRLVEDLAKVGITVKLEEKNELYQAVTRGEFEGLALISRDTSDPGRFMNVPSEGGRLVLERVAGTHFDEEMVERYEAFAGSLYAERKDFLSFAMQEAWFQRLPMIPLVLTSRLAAVREGLSGPEWGVADSFWWNVGDWKLDPR
jgi:ABC-type transport system substrate-binding protein